MNNRVQQTRNIDKVVHVLRGSFNSVIIPLMVTILAAYLIYTWVTKREQSKLSYGYAIASITRQNILYGDSLRCEVRIFDVINKNTVFSAGYSAKQGDISAVPETKEVVIKVFLWNDGRSASEDVQMNVVIDPLDSFVVTSSPNISVNHKLTKTPNREPLIVISVPSLPVQSEAVINISALYDSKSGKMQNYGSAPGIRIGYLSSKEAGEIKHASQILSAGEAFKRELQHFGINAISTYMNIKILKPGIKVQFYVDKNETGILP